jgi:hypothetical protein
LTRSTLSPVYLHLPASLILGMSKTCVSCCLNACRCVPTTTFPPSADWKSGSKNVSKNARNGLFSAHVCYILHVMLVMIHVILVIFYSRHWEHHVTLSFTPTNNDVWPVVLSASLQAFYTVRVHCYPSNTPIIGLDLDIHGCSTLPYPTTCNRTNTCTPPETDCHSRHLWRMGRSRFRTQ